MPTRAQLLLPAVNIPLGTAYLASLWSASTAKRRSRGRLQRGTERGAALAPAAPMDLDVWAENIPFNETRAYVQRVAWHALVFAWLEDRKPRDVSGWLRTVQPESTSTAQSWPNVATEATPQPNR